MLTVRAGGRSWVCHQSVLAARSEFFRGKITQRTLGSAHPKGEVEIDAELCPPEAVALAVNYMYTDTLPVFEGSAEEKLGKIVMVVRTADFLGEE